MMNKKIGAYIKNGGLLFRIKRIDTIRDGGSVIVETTNDNFYLHMRDRTVHTAYPPKDGNKVNDENEIAYLVDRIGAFIKSEEEAIMRNTKLLEQVKMVENGEPVRISQ